VLKFLAELTDAAGYLDRPEDMAPYAREWRGIYESDPGAVLRPRSMEEVAALVRACAAHKIGIVPQGGNTGTVGGSVATRQNIILSLTRLNKIRALNALDYTMTVEAGCILKTAQDAAEEADRYLPLSLGAEGSCTIGGVLSTNAGGVLTLRHGNARALVLGLEVVLPDGQIWNGLRALRKDNTGYDLKQMFVGAEGTLGIITAAVLKLSPRPRVRETAFAAVPDPHHALELLSALRLATGDSIEAFELIPRFGFELLLAHLNAVDPLKVNAPWYVLIEAVSGGNDGVLRTRLEETLGDLPAVIAAGEAQRKALWFLREALPEAQKFTGGMIPHDVGVPVSKVPEFIARVIAAVETLAPGTRPMPFGHVGDGNIHFTLAKPEGMAKEDFFARKAEISAIVYDTALSLGGTFSAEHGIGIAKKDQLAECKSTVELELMRTLKKALDPQGILNPGKLI
jgi:FAD/FMN-containing dehydrogenase